MTGAVAVADGAVPCAKVSELEWNRPPESMRGLRLWLVDLDVRLDEHAQQWLGHSERDRAARFVYERDARRYRAAHVALRQLLLQHCGVQPGTEFEFGEHGKPRLSFSAPFEFNLSHSGERALIGIGPGQGGGLGVDMEVLRDVEDVWPLAEQHFTAGECAQLRALPRAGVARAFLTGWTRKEACLKALGCGLSVVPASFEVGLKPRAQMVVFDTAPGSARVYVESVSAGADMLVAVATVSPSWPTSRGISI